MPVFCACRAATAIGLVTAEHRRRPVSPEAIQAKGMNYVSYFYLIDPADDPGMSLEGIEFVAYPQECARLKRPSLEAWFAHVPGLKVVMSATVADAKGLLKASIRDDNPAVYIWHTLLYDLKGDVPEGNHAVPAGARKRLYAARGGYCCRRATVHGRPGRQGET